MHQFCCGPRSGLPAARRLLDRNSLSTGTPLHDYLVENASIDLPLPRLLLVGQCALEPGTHEKFVFFVVEESTLVRILNDIGVRIRGVVFRDASQAAEQIPRINSDETVDANIPDVGFVSGDAVLDVAMLFDLLAAWAIVDFLTYLNGNKAPLGAGNIESFGSRQRQDMGL